jgi:DNA-binding MarR family transcriptional regulator
VRPARDAMLAAGAIRHALDRRLRGADLPPFELARVMWAIESGERNVRALAAQLGIDRSTTSRTVDRAEAAGLVARSFSFVDERLTWCRLTRHGRSLLPHLDVALAGALADLEQRRRPPDRGSGRYSRVVRKVHGVDPDEIDREPD